MLFSVHLGGIVLPGKSIFLSRQPGCERSSWTAYMVYIIWVPEHYIWFTSSGIWVPEHLIWFTSLGRFGQWDILWMFCTAVLDFPQSYPSTHFTLKGNSLLHTFQIVQFLQYFSLRLSPLLGSDPLVSFLLLSRWSCSVWLKNPAQAQRRALFNRCLFSFKKEKRKYRSYFLCRTPLKSDHCQLCQSN